MVYEVTEVTPEFIEDMNKYREVDKSKGLFENCSKSPILFAQHMLGVKLYAWQVDFMKDLMEVANSDNRAELQKEFVAITSRQVGKAQPLYSKILTPTGWTVMGDINIGDYVIGRDGLPAEVTGVFPQGKVDTYRVYFTDGSYTDCSGEHLWTIKSAGCKNWKVETLNKIIKDRGMNPDSDNAYRIPLTDPIKFKKQQHNISPYLLGVLLGDGCLTSKDTFGITSDDESIIDLSLKDIKYTVSNKKGTSAKNYRIKDSTIIESLKDLGLFGTNSLSKFIPDEYLFDSIENRTELLRGLMDTDGSIYGNCVMEYSSISPKLVKGLKFLVESLGGNVKIKKRKSYSVSKGVRKQCQDSYRVYVRLQNINPFKLERKSSKWYNIKYKRHRIIDKIEKLEDIECQCITVNNESHTYLTDNFIVTHNSTALAIFSIWACIFNKVPATTYSNTTVGISSASDVQAKKLLLEMKKYIRLGDVYVRDTYKDEETGKAIFGNDVLSSLLDESGANNTTTITFKAYDDTIHGDYFLKGSKSGSTIKSYAATAAVLGETFSVVIIDEAGMKDRISDMFFKEYMYPTGNSTHAIRVYTSTPWEPAGFFYRMVDPDDIYGHSPAKLFAFTIDAIKYENPIYYESVQKKINEMEAEGDHNEVQRAYYCRFVKGEQSYFNPDNVLNMIDPNMEMKMTHTTPCDMGIDFGGQVTSKTVITISALNDEGVIERLYHQSYEVGKDMNLLDDIESLMEDFNISRIIVDDCPAGSYFIRIMEDEKGWNIQRMNFRAEKVKKYGGFRSMLKKDKIKSYEDDILKTEMLAMEFNNGARNSILQHAPGYTDDLIDSFVMSCYFFIEDEGRFKTFDVTEVKNDTIHDKKKIFRTRTRDLQGLRRRQDPFTE